MCERRNIVRRSSWRRGLEVYVGAGGTKMGRKDVAGGVWGMCEESLMRKEGRARACCTAEHSGWEKTAELGLYLAGNREPEKTVELERP